MAMKADLLKGSSIVLVLENESNTFGESAENCVDIVRTVDSVHLKLAYDPGNFVCGGGIINNVELCWPLMKRYTVHVHIKDWKLGNTHKGSMPGEGDGHIKQLLAELRKIGYDGYLTLEPHLKAGGQFSGKTGPALFAQAIHETMKLCDETCLAFS